MKHVPVKNARSFLHILGLGVLLPLLAALSSCGGFEEKGGKSGRSAGARSGVSSRMLRAHVAYLASDGLGGRKTGTPGVEKAEAYIARSFRECGLEPVPGRDDYFLDFTVYRHGFDPGGTILYLRPATDGGRRDQPRFPALHISRELARTVTGASGWEPEDLEGELGRGAGASDISLLVDELPVSGANLRCILEQAGAGERVTLAVLKQGERLRLALTLGRRHS
jgi:hypothetical protein